jgi:hypothetical protein
VRLQKGFSKTLGVVATRANGKIKFERSEGVESERACCVDSDKVEISWDANSVVKEMGFEVFEK